MSIHVEWGTSAQTLIIWRAAGDISLDSYVAASRKTNALLQSVAYPVTILLDLRKCHHTSHNLIPTLREQIRRLQGFQGEFVVLSKTQFWQSMYQIAAQSSIGMRLPTIRFHISQDENGDVLATLS
jgi:hypothetical protein